MMTVSGRRKVTYRGVAQAAPKDAHDFVARDLTRVVAVERLTCRDTKMTGIRGERVWVVFGWGGVGDAGPSKSAPMLERFASSWGVRLPPARQQGSEPGPREGLGEG